MAGRWLTGGGTPPVEEPMMAKERKKEDREETEKPWERPGQVAQNPDEKAPSKKDVDFEQASKTS